jgi:hypothetical protein
MHEVANGMQKFFRNVKRLAAGTGVRSWLDRLHRWRIRLMASEQANE